MAKPFEFIKKIFSKEKKTMANLDEMLKSLTAEEKAELKAKLEDLNKAEDEREIDKIEEEKSDDKAVSNTKAEEVKKESEEVEKDANAVEETEDGVKEQAEDETAKRFDALEERLAVLEEALKGKDKIETAKEKYGLENKPISEETKKSYSDEDVKKLLG